MKATEINWGDTSNDPKTWGFTATKGGIRHSNLHNINVALSHDPVLHGLVRYDGFLDRLQTETREWHDEDDTRIAMYLQQHHRLDRVSAGMVRDVFSQRAKLAPTHCVRDWLESLVWDRIDRVALAFEEYWGANPGPTQPDGYLRAVSQNFFIALIARVMQPGCKVDTMVVFEGPQGALKSSALQALVTPAWQVTQHESVTTKDFFQVLTGKWIVEIAELDSFSRAEVTRVKSVMSTSSDRYRASYGRTATDHPRQCVFAGTANRDDWGRDETGLRRFWPVRCGTINLAALREMRGQLFAEALWRYRQRATWWEVPDSAKEVQADRQAESAWLDAVRDYVIDKDELTLLDLLKDALKIDVGKITRSHEIEAGRVLRLLGWDRAQRREAGSNPKRVWTRPFAESETLGFESKVTGG